MTRSRTKAPRDDYFARVRPLLGNGLAGRRLAIDSPAAAARVVELLAGCMLDEILIEGEDRRTFPRQYSPDARWPGEGARGLRRYLRWKNRFVVPSVRKRNGSRVDASLSVHFHRRPSPVWTDWSVGRVDMHVPQHSLHAWLDASHAVARTLRDVLLGRTEWPEGRRYLGDPRWPFAELEAAAQPSLEPPQSLKGRHIMVVGAGSLGSEAIRWLSGQGARWTLIDAADVSVFNPHRQWFSIDEVGTPKVAALARRLRREHVRAITAPARPESFWPLIANDRPDLVLLCTGTRDHGPLAEILWEEEIPHVAACAYPQARYYEVTVVAPHESTPCLGCYRGHLYRGVEAMPAVSDEVAQFVYAEADDGRRSQRWTDLVAEPASPIETGRIAEVVARAARELVAAPEQRSPWFQRMLAQDTTCLLGGNVVERTPDGDFAYGIERPGQVVRLGLEDICGVSESVRCGACGRNLHVRHRIEVPVAPDADQDAALLAMSG